MRVKWAEMGKAGWLEGLYSPRGSLAFVSYLILFLPVLCSVPHDLLTESCSAAVFTSWHKFIFVCWPITPTASTVVYFILLHPLELLLTVSLLSRDGLFGTGACWPAKLMDHICYLTSCKGSSFRTACSCCGHLYHTGRAGGHCPCGIYHPSSRVSLGSDLPPGDTSEVCLGANSPSEAECHLPGAGWHELGCARGAGTAHSCSGGCSSGQRGT